MTAACFSHIAQVDEPIPAPNGRRMRSPDMRGVAPVEQMTTWLDAVADDDVAYVQLWRGLVASIGCTIDVHYHRDGEVSLMMGSPVDIQCRHRSRWMQALLDHLDAIEGRRDALNYDLRRAHRVIDERPSRPRETTVSVRDFLRVGGRIMIRPDGQIDDGGASAAFRIDAPVSTADAVARYYEVRRRFNTDGHLRRIVQRLGTPVNGWTVLGGRA